MENISNEDPGNKWLSVPLIATVTRLLCRECDTPPQLDEKLELLFEK